MTRHGEASSLTRPLHRPIRQNPGRCVVAPNSEFCLLSEVKQGGAWFILGWKKESMEFMKAEEHITQQVFSCGETGKSAGLDLNGARVHQEELTVEELAELQSA